jgi:hypothetical protein
MTWSLRMSEARASQRAASDLPVDISGGLEAVTRSLLGSLKVVSEREAKILEACETEVRKARQRLERDDSEYNRETLEIMERQLVKVRKAAGLE